MPRAFSRWIVVATLGLSACEGQPEFSSPLGDPSAASRAGDRLAGVWVPYDGNPYVLHIESDGKGGLRGNVVVSSLGSPPASSVASASPPRVRWWHGSGHVTEIDGALYLSFRRDRAHGDDYTADGLEPGYSIAAIQFDGDDLLRVRFTDGIQLEDLVRAGRIKGRTVVGPERTGSLKYLYLPVGTDELRELMRTLGPEKLFYREEGVFRRVVAARAPSK